MGIAAALLDLLYPPRCVFCRALLASATPPLVCPACREDGLPRTFQGGTRYGRHFARCVAPLYYEGVVRDSVLRYKFGGLSVYGETYGLLLADCIRKFLEGRWDRIAWAPLSRNRLRQRGYDQAWLLADAAARALGTEAVPLLEKVRDVKRQSSISSAEERRRNVAGVYRGSAPGQTAGARVLLIDDIATTGATLEECAAALRAVGAAEVVCAVLAMDGT